MCGIVGVLQYQSEVDRETRARALRILFSEAMLKTEPRGDDATGLYQVHANGDWMLGKKGEKVTKWLRAPSGGDEPVVYDDFVETWDLHPHDMTALVGHCRKATVGSKGKDNKDNHPFAVQLDESNAILGIHNGTLHNHEIIFRKLKELSDSQPVRQGTVDSESIFHMMYHISQQGTIPFDGDMLKYMGTRLDGAYACIVANSRFPHQVTTFREGRPMEYYMIAPLNIVLIVSEKRFAESAFEKYEFFRQFAEGGHLLPELKGEHRNLVEKDYRIFDLTKPFPKTLSWNAFDDISEKGTMLKSKTDLDKDWEKPSTTTTTTTTTTSRTTTTGGSGSSAHKPNYSASATKKGGTSAANPGSKTTIMGPTTTTAKKGADDDEVTTVEAEVVSSDEKGEQGARESYTKAQSLGLCPIFDMEREIASVLGITEVELAKLSKTDLATKLAEVHFAYGYAVARTDVKSEIDEVRRKGREMLKKMEKTAEKQRRAQSHIWELKQAMVIFFALAEGGYPLNLHNLGIVLNGYMKYNETRRQDILKVAQAIFEDQSAEKQIEELVAEFEIAAKKKKAAGSAEEK